MQDQGERAASDGRDADEIRADKARSFWTFVLACLGLALTGLTTWQGWMLDQLAPAATWALIAALFIIVLAAAGKRANGLWWGALIDNRNRVSLSRVQLITWTVVVISAWFAIFIPRIADSELSSDRNLSHEAFALLGTQALGQTDEAREAQVDKCVADFITEYEATAKIASLDELSVEAQTAVRATANDECRTPAELLALDIDLCRDAHLVNRQGIEDITLLQVSEPEAAAAARLEASEACEPDAASVVLPAELLLVMGISVTSITGAKLVKTSKRRTPLSLKGDEQRIAELESKTQTFEESLELAKKQHLAAEQAVAAQQAKIDTATSALKQESDTTILEEKKAELAQLKVSFETDVKAQAEAKKAEEQAKTTLDTHEKNLKAAKAERDVKNVVSASGTLKTNAHAKEAELTDMFLGDEVGDFDKVDASKVQMFLFTVVLVFAYIVLVVDLLGRDAELLNAFEVEMPAFTSSMVTLLAISHAGYIGVKSTDKTNAGHDGQPPAS